MRKYFLLGAVALLAASNANAQTYASGNLGVRCMIANTEEIDCGTDILGFGAYINDNSNAFSITVTPDGNTTNTYPSTGSGSVIADGQAGKCVISNGTFTDAANIQLGTQGDIKMVSMGTNGNEHGAMDIVPTISDITFAIADDGKTVNIGGTFNIPANIETEWYQAIIPILYMSEE